MRWVVTVVALLMPGILLSGAVSATPRIQPQGTQMAASDDPEVEGPLELKDSKCDRKRQLDGDVTAAVAKRCLRYYSYDPGSESDPSHDYGAVWLQSTVDGRNGWCATRVASKIVLPLGLGLHNRAPDGGQKVARRQETTTSLVIDANGTGSQGRVAQRWIAFPQSYAAFVNKDMTAFTLKWRGDTKEKLGFAHGIEISWDTDSPPEGISYKLNFKLAEC